jgi:hypothetical protein
LSHCQRVLLDYIHARITNRVLEIIPCFLFQVLGYYLEYYDKALAIQPNYVDALYGKGIALGNLGNYTGACRTSFHICAPVNMISIINLYNHH